ncbi:MAG: hypothetical protein KGY80_04965 [Candidatus Thorarchaeota archaeon]|nr:hypothetical protein [Candidatus Thorarchaeota archaeon]
MSTERRVDEVEDYHLPKQLGIILTISALLFPYWVLIEFGYIPSFVMWAGTWMLTIYKIEGP